MAVFFRRGKSAAYFVPTLASPSAPTATAIAAGTDLSKAVVALNGFEIRPQNIQQPVMAYPQDLQIAGAQQFPDVSIQLLEGDGVAGGDETAYAAAYTALAEGSSGYIVLCPKKAGAPAAADKVDVWPVTIASKDRDWSIGNETAKYTVTLSVTSAPSKNATVA